MHQSTWWDRGCSPAVLSCRGWSDGRVQQAGSLGAQLVRMLAGGQAAVADAAAAAGGAHGSPGRPPCRAGSPVADPCSAVGAHACAAAVPHAGLRLGAVAPAGEPSLVVPGTAALRSPAPGSLHAATSPQADMLTAAAVRSARRRLLAGGTGAAVHAPASAQGKATAAVQTGVADPVSEATQGSAAAPTAVEACQPASLAHSQADAAARLQRQNEPGKMRCSRHSLWGRWDMNLGSLMGFGRVRAASSGQQLAAVVAGAGRGSAGFVCSRCAQPWSRLLRDLVCQLRAESWLQALCCD